MSFKNNSRYLEAKKTITNERNKVDELKTEIRKEFKSRLRTIRNQSFDANRNISQKDLINQGYNQMKEMLLSTAKEGSMDENEVLEALNLVQQEMFDIEAENHLIDEENITDALVANLLCCKICEKVLNDESNEFCDACALELVC